MFNTLTYNIKFFNFQVSITNEIHQHLGNPKFLLCPTQYCSTRAVPTVNTSEYLNTLGTKLLQEIDIMWTGLYWHNYALCFYNKIVIIIDNSHTLYFSQTR